MNDTTIETADKLLDDNQFALAREAYRRAITSAPSNVALETFANLSIAEERAALSFLQDTARLNPEFGAVRVSLAHAYMNVRQPQLALKECTEILERNLFDDTRLVRMVRYKAAVRAQAYGVACEDFVFIWNLGKEPAIRGLRRTLLKEISAIIDPLAGRLFSEIHSALPHDVGLHRFLSLKDAELQELATVLGGC